MKKILMTLTQFETHLRTTFVAMHNSPAWARRRMLTSAREIYNAIYVHDRAPYFDAFIVDIAAYYLTLKERRVDALSVTRPMTCLTIDVKELVATRGATRENTLKNLGGLGNQKYCLAGMTLKILRIIKFMKKSESYMSVVQTKLIADMDSLIDFVIYYFAYFKRLRWFL